MNIVICPDSYKESLPAHEVALAIEAGFREIFPDATYVRLPLADGGEGTVHAMVAATGGRIVDCSVTGPLGTPVPAYFGLTGNGRTAVIEMAAASGLALVPPALRNPLLTTSYGTGELVRRALDAGVAEIIMGIGGSATNDGGAGMLQALGVKLLDGNGQDLGFGGGELARLQHMDVSNMDPRLGGIVIEVACDVDNPLLGKKGASAVFGPQKGASPDMVAHLDECLTRFADVIFHDLGTDVAKTPGAGAAGGMGAALLAIGGTLRSGIDIVMAAVGLATAIEAADLIITGEGCIDGQTIHGKVPVGVARMAKRFGKPVLGISGSLAPDADMVYAQGIDAAFSVLTQVCTREEALARAAENIRRAARNIAATIRLARALHCTHAPPFS